MKEFDRIFEWEKASFKLIACHNTEHINGVLLGVGRGDFVGQDKFIPHKDGSVHYDTEIFLSPERFKFPSQDSSTPAKKPLRNPLQGEFVLVRSPKLNPLILA